jgi:hypothetical protein
MDLLEEEETQTLVKATEHTQGLLRGKERAITQLAGSGDEVDVSVVRHTWDLRDPMGRRNALRRPESEKNVRISCAHTRTHRFP